MSESDRPAPVVPMPLPLSPFDTSAYERGVIERLDLILAVLRDIRGHQRALALNGAAFTPPSGTAS